MKKSLFFVKTLVRYLVFVVLCFNVKNQTKRNEKNESYETYKVIICKYKENKKKIGNYLKLFYEKDKKKKEYLKAKNFIESLNEKNRIKSINSLKEKKIKNFINKLQESYTTNKNITNDLTEKEASFLLSVLDRHDNIITFNYFIESLDQTKKSFKKKQTKNKKPYGFKLEINFPNIVQEYNKFIKTEEDISRVSFFVFLHLHNIKKNTNINQEKFEKIELFVTNIFERMKNYIKLKLIKNKTINEGYIDFLNYNLVLILHAIEYQITPNEYKILNTNFFGIPEEYFVSEYLEFFSACCVYQSRFFLFRNIKNFRKNCRNECFENIQKTKIQIYIDNESIFFLSCFIFFLYDFIHTIEIFS